MITFEQELENHYRKIKLLLTKGRFEVQSLTAVIDDASSPEIGFMVQIKGKESVFSRTHVENLLKNYCYRIEFVG